MCGGGGGGGRLGRGGSSRGNLENNLHCNINFFSIDYHYVLKFALMVFRLESRMSVELAEPKAQWFGSIGLRWCPSLQTYMRLFAILVLPSLAHLVLTQE